MSSPNEFVDNGAPLNGAPFTRGWGVNGAGFGSADLFSNRGSDPGARRRPWNDDAIDPKPGGTRESATAVAQQQSKSRGVACTTRATGRYQKQERARCMQEEAREPAKQLEAAAEQGEAAASSIKLDGCPHGSGQRQQRRR